MSRIHGCVLVEWVLATETRVPESLLIDDEDADHVLDEDIPESQDDKFA